MKKNWDNLIFVAFALFAFSACTHHAVHKAQFYNNIGEGNATDNGYHANEAKRLLDYNDLNKEANQKHAKETQEKLNSDLGKLNKPNSYNAKTTKPQKKKFKFYM